MSISLANNFTAANNWQREQRDRYLIHFYQKYSLQGRYVFIDKSTCSSLLQKQLAVDTVMQSGKSSLCIEEKIDTHTGSSNFALETDSCTVIGREKPGWMHYGRADYLLYAFICKGGGLDVYLIDFPKLRDWFWEVYQDYPYYVQPTSINHSGVRLVRIADVLRNVPTWQYRCTDDGCMPILKRGVAA